jgi:hypothetical protein
MTLPNDTHLQSAPTEGKLLVQLGNLIVLCYRITCWRTKSSRVVALKGHRVLTLSSSSNLCATRNCFLQTIDFVRDGSHRAVTESVCATGHTRRNVRQDDAGPQ